MCEPVRVSWLGPRKLRSGRLTSAHTQQRNYRAARSCRVSLLEKIGSAILQGYLAHKKTPTPL